MGPGIYTAAEGQDLGPLEIFAGVMDGKVRNRC